MMIFMERIRRMLDGLYLASGIAAAFCLIAILFLIVMQMLARWTGEMFPGAPHYAGYAMAAASFLAFANALNHGAHIRVSIVLNAVSPFWNRIINTACFVVGTAVAWYLFITPHALPSGHGNFTRSRKAKTLQLYGYRNLPW